MNRDQQPAVKFNDVWFGFNGQPVLEGVDLEIQARQFVALVGPNGGGKTTMLKLMLGLIRPQRGTIAVLGTTPERARPRVGYMPQYAAVDPSFPVTVLDVVLMGRLGRSPLWGFWGGRDRELGRKALKRVGVDDLAGRPLSALSGGQRQRVLIARALMSEPELLLLDEPTSNVDAAAEQELYELLAELSREITLLVVTHDLGFVSSRIETVVCVNRTVKGHPTCDISSDIINELYGHPVQMVRHDHHLPAGRRPEGGA